MKKRLLAVVLTIAMVLSFVPFASFADEVNYGSGLNDTATYAMKVPDVGVYGPGSKWQDSTGAKKISVRQENGENFWVYDQEFFGGVDANTTVRAAQFTYGQTAGVPASVELANAKYLAMRIKINDFNEAGVYQDSLFRVFIQTGTGSAFANHRIDTNKGNCGLSPNYYLSLEDGSLTRFIADDNSGNRYGIRTTGSLNGYVLIPLEHPTTLTEEVLETAFRNIKVEFTRKTGSAAWNKYSNWDNKEFLLGDCFFVDDLNAFAAARKPADVATYSVPGTGYYGFRISPLRSYYQAWAASGYGQPDSIGKAFGDPLAQNTIAQRALHINVLEGGDRAIAIIPNAGVTAVNEALFYVWDTYADSMKASTTNNLPNQRVKGVPDDIDMSKITNIAIRFKIKAPTQTKLQTIIVAGSSVMPLNNVDYDFADKKTGEISTLRYTSTRFLITGEYDGYLFVPIDSWGVANATEAYDLVANKANWDRMQINLPGNVDGSELTGLEFYLGETYFVEDKAAFIAANTAVSGCAAGDHNYQVTDVKENACNEFGYTTYTCADCGDVLVSDAVEWDPNHPWGEEGVVTAPTETECGYTTYTCTVCGSTKDVDYTAPLSGKVANTAAAKLGDSDMLITWDKLVGADKYIASVFDAAGAKVRNAQTTKNSIQFYGLEEGDYTVKVIARVGGKWFSVDNADAAAISYAGVSAPIATSSSVSYNAITATWDAVDTATKYFIKVNGGDVARVYNTTDTSLALANLDANTEYSFSICAKLSNGSYTEYSAPTVIKTADYATSTLTSEAVEGGKVKLSWTPEAGKVWVKLVGTDGSKTQVAVVSGASSVELTPASENALYCVVSKITVDGVARYVTSNVVSAGSARDAYRDAILAGGTVVVNEDLDLNPTETEPFEQGNPVTKDVTLDMGDNTIVYDIYYDLWPEMLNGTSISALTAKEGATITLNSGNIDATSDYGIYAYDGNVVINDGYIKAGTSAIQVRKGTVTINGGTFENIDGSQYLINCIDSNYNNGSAKVIIKGGTFIGWNPADNASEGAGTNYVAEGYTVVQEGNVYTVVPA